MFCDRISSSLWNCKIKIQIINRCLNTPSIFYLLAWLRIHCAHFNRVSSFFSSLFSIFYFVLLLLLCHLLVHDATMFLFSFSLFFFLLLSFSDTNDIPPSPIVLFCGLQRKKNYQEIVFLLSGQQTWSTRMREEETRGFPILFVVRDKSFRTEVHRSLFLFLFQIWPCWTRWWTRQNPGTRQGSRIVCFITVPDVYTVSLWKVTVIVITSTSAGTNRDSNALIASWRASKRRRSTVTSERNIRPRRFAWSISITRRGEKIPLSVNESLRGIHRFLIKRTDRFPTIILYTVSDNKTF